MAAHRRGRRLSLNQADDSKDSGSTDLRKWFVEESGEWVGDGLISPRQRARIGARYGIEIETAGRPQIAAFLSMRVLVTIAALALLSAGILLVVAANWDLLNYWQRLALAGGATAVASIAASLVDRPGRRHIVSQVVDVVAVAGIIGVAAITSQHLQESTADWLRNIAISLGVAALYAEARRNDAVAAMAWASFAGVGMGWVGEVVSPERVGSIDLSGWSGFAAGLALAIRARGWWTPLFAIAAGLLLGLGLVIASSPPQDRDVTALTLAGASGGIIAVSLVVVRFRARPGPAWMLALIGTLISAASLLWVNIWIRLADIAPDIERPVVEATVWMIASLTAIAAVVLLNHATRLHGNRPFAREVFRWVVYTFGVASVFVPGLVVADPGHNLPSNDLSGGYSGQAAIADGALLLIGVLVIGGSWLILDRIMPAETNKATKGRLGWFLTPAAALALGGIVSTLWIPAARLIGQLDPGLGAEHAVAWSVGASGAVWIVAILAERTRQFSGLYFRVGSALVVVVGVVLAISLFLQPEDLLIRGLTFAAIAGLLLVAIGRNWLRSVAGALRGRLGQPVGNSTSADP